MANVAQAARAWHQAGVSTIPVLSDGTKKAAVQWGEYQVHLPDLGQLDHWWANGKELGLALIMGKVSGNLEMLELEARACEPEMLLRIEDECRNLGILDKWYMFVETMYQEESPSGGLHWIYRIADHPVPGNEKVARRPATPEELAENPQDKIKVLSETRGEGGYVIVAPTSGMCHPSGHSWTLLRGDFGRVSPILWETRCLIHEAIRRALDIPVVSNVPVPVTAPSSSGVDLAGTGHMWDEFDRTTHFPTLLRDRGWQESRGGREWTRPGKEPRDGISATLDHDGTNRLFVFSTASGLETDRYYSPFEFLAYFDFGGDVKRALRELRIIEPPPSIHEWEYVSEVAPPPARNYTLTDTGNSQRLADSDRVRGKFHWVHETNQFMYWNGSKWDTDRGGALIREWQDIAQTMSVDPVEKVAKWGNSSLAHSKITGCVNLFKSVLGVTKSTQDFDTNRDLLNVQNGTLNLRTGTLSDHDSRNMITRTFGADYDPHATSPNWDAFLEQTIPDPQMRAYIQRAAGYSLLGGADQRSLFVLHGPSGTGKSTFLETLRLLFADYGVTAPAGAFKQRREGGPSNDLHSLRAKRFVTTSETAEQANFDEELLKRLTGRDSLQSRELYEGNQEWTPECVVWIATNHAPRFNSDDDAIWRRMKLIPFPNPVSFEAEIPDMARRVLVPEAAGILNWLLAGLRDFLANGLGEPEMVAAASNQVRRQGDSVARFVDDQVAGGMLVVSDTGRIPTKILLGLYREWCRENNVKPLGITRFTNRMESLFPDVRPITNVMWSGLSTSVTMGLAGTLFT